LPARGFFKEAASFGKSQLILKNGVRDVGLNKPTIYRTY